MLSRFGIRLLLAVVVVIATVGAGYACGTLDGSRDGCDGSQDGCDGTDDCCGSSGACKWNCGGNNSAEDTDAADKTSSDDGAASEYTATANETATGEPSGDAAETPREPACMLDVFKRLAVGDWVRTRWTNKETHTLLVAAKTDTLITIEEIVHNPKLTAPIAWTQLDVSLEDGSLAALRERLADGTIEKREPSAESQRGTSDLLTQAFRPDGADELRLDPIEVYADGTKTGTTRGPFQCRRYRITVEKGRYAHVWFSRVKLAQYPVKIHYYEENLTIKLEAFGTGRASDFTTPPQEPRRSPPTTTD